LKGAVFFSFVAKKRLSLSQSTNVLAESGGDAEISEIQRLVGKAGFVWAQGPLIVTIRFAKSLLTPES